MSELDFLNPDESPEPTAAAIEPAEAPPEPVAEPQGQPRGPDGKFAPRAEAAPEPAPEPSAAPAPEPVAEQPKVPEGMVPVSVLQALRDEIKELKRAPQQPAPPRLEPGDEGFEEQQYREAVRAEAMAEARVALARDFAIEKHGEEKVQAALMWAYERAEADPVFRVQSAQARDPVAFAIAEQQRHEGLTFAAEMFADPQAREQFMAWRSGQAQPQPAASAPSIPQPPTPPRSLASAPAAGGDKPGAIPVHEGAAFDATFTR